MAEAGQPINSETYIPPPPQVPSTASPRVPSRTAISNDSGDGVDSSRLYGNKKHMNTQDSFPSVSLLPASLDSHAQARGPDSSGHQLHARGPCSTVPHPHRYGVNNNHYNQYHQHVSQSHRPLKQAEQFGVPIPISAGSSFPSCSGVVPPALSPPKPRALLEDSSGTEVHDSGAQGTNDHTTTTTTTTVGKESRGKQYITTTITSITTTNILLPRESQKNGSASSSLCMEMTEGGEVCVLVPSVQYRVSSHSQKESSSHSHSDTQKKTSLRNDGGSSQTKIKEQRNPSKSHGSYVSSLPNCSGDRTAGESMNRKTKAEQKEQPVLLNTIDSFPSASASADRHPVGSAESAPSSSRHRHRGHGKGSTSSRVGRGTSTSRVQVHAKSSTIDHRPTLSDVGLHSYFDESYRLRQPNLQDGYNSHLEGTTTEGKGLTTPTPLALERRGECAIEKCHPVMLKDERGETCSWNVQR